VGLVRRRKFRSLILEHSVNKRFEIVFGAVVSEFDSDVVLYFHSAWEMECDMDASGRISRWKYAPKVVRVDIVWLDGRRGTKLDAPILISSKATPHEKDLLATRDRSMVWADLFKGNPSRTSSNSGGCGLLRQNRRRSRGRRCDGWSRCPMGIV
jgi:hypothetical protein